MLIAIMKGFIHDNAQAVIDGLILLCAVIIFIATGYWLLAILAALLLVSFYIALVIWNHRNTETGKLNQRLISIIVVAIVSFIIMSTMGLSPAYNGEDIGHRNQYEVMASSLIDGNISLEYDVDPKLAAMDNPYAPDAREQAGASYHFDAAYYNGKYYMYFGIVPVLILFVPYQLLTGVPLATYHATQVFTVLYLIGLFALFWFLRKRFFPVMEQRHFYLLYCASAFASTWYVAATPALYCTAIISGMCMEVWSLFFFMKAVYDTDELGDQFLWGFFGAIFGALAIGCRPTVAIANLLVLPMLVRFMRDNDISPRFVFGTIFAALPYIVIVGNIFAYNYMRFDSIFEFGQSYQLTLADQHGYADIVSQIMNANFSQIGEAFIALRSTRYEFPGLLLEFPFLLFLLLPLNRNVRKYLKEQRLFPMFVVLIISVALIVFVQCFASPWLLERYKVDFIWLMAIGVFIACGAGLCSFERSEHSLLRFAIGWLCLFAVIASIAFFFVPCAQNFASLLFGMYG